MCLPPSRLVLFLALGDLAFAVSNSSLLEMANDLTTASATWRGGRRDGDTDHNSANEPKKKKKTADRSTSSDSKDKKEEYENDSMEDDSLQLSDEQDEYNDKKNQKDNHKYMPKSSEERKGWKKWHRKCTPCDEDTKTKWRNPGIKWICGAYQTARRSFKSPCVMRLRNCQDGTMFVKIYDHKCNDDPERGAHFFYDYKVLLTDETRSSHSAESSDEKSAETGSYGSEDTRRALRMRRAGGRAKGVVIDGPVTAKTSQSTKATVRQPRVVRNNTNQPKS